MKRPGQPTWQSIGAAFALLAVTETGAIDINQHALTGSWHQPAMGGQGIMLEVYPDAVAPGTGFVQGSWFTHKLNGHWDYDWEHRWYTFSGSAPGGQSSATLTIYQNLGGNFNALPATSAVAVGTVVLAFQDCATATLKYAFTDGSGRSGTIPLTRLTPDVTCSAQVDAPTSADFGYSGNWFDPAKSGQGFVLELNPNARAVFFAWFTYAPSGQAAGAAGQLWYTGHATYVPGARTLPVTLYLTYGNSFDSGDPHVAFHSPVGSATMTLVSCDKAMLAFTIDAFAFANLGRSGTIDLSRVGPTPRDCGP